MYRSQTIGTSEMRKIVSGSAEILPGECLSDVHGVTEYVGCDRETRLICHLLHGTYRSFGDIYVSFMYHIFIIVYRTYGEWVHLDPGYSMCFSNDMGLRFCLSFFKSLVLDVSD